MLKKERKMNMLISTGKFAVAIYLCCLFLLVFSASMLAGIMTKEVLMDCAALALVVTGAGLVALGVVNLAATLAQGIYGNPLKSVKDGTFKKMASGILACSVLGKQALAPLVASSLVTIAYVTAKGGFHAENIISCISLTLVVTGTVLIFVGVLGITREGIKSAASWLKTHKISLIKIEQR